MSFAALSPSSGLSRPRWLQSIRRTILIGLGPLASCWHWLVGQGGSAHQRHQKEEERRRKHRQHRPQIRQTESRGSPGVPVDPGAMLMAGLAGVQIFPQGLFGQSSQPSILMPPLPTPPVEASGASLTFGATLGAPADTDLLLSQWQATCTRFNASLSASDTARPTQDTPLRMYDDATSQ